MGIRVAFSIEMVQKYWVDMKLRLITELRPLFFFCLCIDILLLIESVLLRKMIKSVDLLDMTNIFEWILMIFVVISIALITYRYELWFGFMIWKIIMLQLLLLHRVSYIYTGRYFQIHNLKSCYSRRELFKFIFWFNCIVS